ncbi:hypothetical protein [Erythrobacter sp. F6033]|uniref:hypothetical protein n=1 Tax=Erythrobacter sp. F6033 TaxID=2926401 RepID=UPI001FF5C597|nr:hypothetical protein [Erythrobacter sp. F6033]MCK0127044.1 hypothetical protein [Erythrobacter sp. F6033]
MSSKAEPDLRFSTFAICFAAFAGLAAPVSAQDDGNVTSEDDTEEAAEEAGPPPEPLRLDLSVTVPKAESDQLLEEDCEEEADAARIANEIIVCRQLGEATDGSWNKEEWQKRYAEKTKGRSTPNTFGIANHGNAIGFGSVPPPAIFIDVEALPQAPEGSDADRIARGLPPLGKDPEPSPDEIAERRRKLGLDAPPVRSDPE